MNRIQLRAYIELGAAMVIVGSIVVVSKMITATFPVFLASALRFVIALAILLPLWLKEGRGVSLPGRRDAWIMFLQSFAGNFLYGILLLYGLKWTSAVEGGIILGTTPVVIGLISFLFLRESLGWNKWIALLIATVGIGVINTIGAAPAAGQGALPLLGNILVFGSVVGEALWMILAKVLSVKVTPLTVASMTSFFGLLLFSPFAVYQATSFDFAAVPLLSWTLILYYGVGTVCAYVLWYRVMTKVSASTAGVFTGIQPVSAVVLSNMLLQEPMVWSSWVGILSVLSAIVLTTCSVSRTDRQEKTAYTEGSGNIITGPGSQEPALQKTEMS
jgi:drug/metabolite transporter (DMT)-like permease